MYRFNSLAKFDDNDKDMKLYFSKHLNYCIVVDSNEKLNQMKIDIGSDAYFVIPKNLGDKIIVFDFIRWK